MRTRGPNSTIATKPVLLAVFFLLGFLLVIVFRSSSLPSCQPIERSLHAESTTCNKLSPATAETLVHYVTSNITPQQTFKEISVSLRVLNKKAPCNFLVFGLGYDSPMWAALNHGGRTVFLEEDNSWIQQIQSKFPSLESYHVVYDTKVAGASDLMEIGKLEECKVVEDPRVSKCELSLKGKLAEEVYEVEWDLIMVDAPTGYHDEAPGRMKAIYTAGLIGRNRADGETDVFVHDVDRVVEDEFSKAFFNTSSLQLLTERFRHEIIPSSPKTSSIFSISSSNHTLRNRQFIGLRRHRRPLARVSSTDRFLRINLPAEGHLTATRFGARDDISSFLPVASDSTDFEASFCDAREYEEP